MRRRTVVGVAIAVAIVAAVAVARPDRPMRVGAGVVAHNLCSAVFVGGHDAEASYRELVRPVVGEPAAALYGYRIDAATRRVCASFAGIPLATAVETPGYGCRLVHAGDAPPPPPKPLAASAVDDDFAPSTVVVATQPAIASAIDAVFAERDPTQPKRVKAVVVVKDGRVIAERYAPGFGVDTPLLSYSVAKSFTNALVGILVREKRLRVDEPLGAAEWSTSGDARARITIEDLLRMRSGLDAVEAESGSDPVSLMLYLRSDMAAYAASRPAKVAPGTEWEYTSANTLLVDRRIGELVGGGAAGLRAFAERALFGPARLANVTFEFDGRGTFFGSSYVWAPARSFARFGQLYLDDGVARDGTRVLPEGWVAWSRRSTLGRGYGAGWFTNDGSDEFSALRVQAGFPKDGFFASGFLGQRVYVVPSAKLVVARFGYSTGPTFGIRDDLALIRAAIGETNSSGSD